MPRCRHRPWAAWLALWAALIASAAIAADPEEKSPSRDAEPVLTVVDDGQARELGLRAIEQLERHRVELRHFEGLDGVFTGVRLWSFLREYGLADARRLRFIAADDYTIFLEPEAVRERGFLLVTRFDGEPIPRTRLGPLMLVVPDEAEAVRAGEISPTDWMWSIIEIRAQ